MEWKRESLRSEIPSGSPRKRDRLSFWLLVAAALVLIASAVSLAEIGDRQGPQAGGVKRLSASGPPLPSGEVRFMAIDRAGMVWFRMVDPDGGPDRVIVIDPAGASRSFADLRSMVEAERAAILSQGTLPDFWAVDATSNIWVGPAYYDGRQWVDVARSESHTGGSLVYEERVIVDPAGNAWVPYRTSSDCPTPGACEGGGLAGFDARGQMIGDIALDTVPDLARLGLPPVRFDVLADGTVIAATSRAAYLLPSTTPHVYPGLEVDPATGMRNPGFASAASARPDGDAAIFTWIEPLAANPIPLVAEVTGVKTTWQGTSLGNSPLFDEGTRGQFITAAAYAGDGALWVASSNGELAEREGGRWTEHYTAENSPLGDPIRDLAVDSGGAVWVAGSGGVRVNDGGVWRTGGEVYLPYLLRDFHTP